MEAKLSVNATVEEESKGFALRPRRCRIAVDYLAQSASNDAKRPYLRVMFAGILFLDNEDCF